MAETREQDAGRRAAAAARFSATWRIAAADLREAESVARDIALEQTVEIPADCVPEAVAAARVVAEIEALVAVPGGFDATLSFREDMVSDGAAGLLNVLHGNVSLKRGARLVGFAPSPGLLAGFAGPRFGIDGLRRMMAAPRRPLSATAIKPLGLDARALARLAGGYARGGVDIVKDDHGVIDQRAAPFEERIARCQEAVAAANAATGGHTLYVPMIAGRFDRLESQFSVARAEGVRAVMVAPMLSGPDVVDTLAARYDLALIAHPSFAGAALGDAAQGMTPALLLGTLFRLIGADVSIFPNAGGRFTFSRADCQDIARALRDPMGGIAPALPSPAGGMGLHQVGEMIDSFGRDTLLLIGGALMRHSPDPERGAAAFREAIEAADATTP
ncbi:RuBisCO large subunit C-terminal-like domain-containing protein [Rhodovulum strictum]|uniref:Ribulose 1,5-bisphosphate carboxylase n=1 Tax=Rhodovulum strictum TaxID=58314 RepID=A0A844B3I5_9RHOB|nr:RuBisCO large subunit C-terminal-like domain-containing protein [Rhodovulum strictum]MRH20701.1 ribulose 1,5-bisphosphate carboxylase [Rhodovulum strictum]